jgi:hypothetical protein
VLDRASGETRTLRDGGISIFSPPNWSAASSSVVVSRTPSEKYSRQASEESLEALVQPDRQESLHV